MSRKILMYVGAGPSPEEAVYKISYQKTIKIIERYGQNIVVEGNVRAIESLLGQLNGWRASSVRRIKYPDSKIKIRRMR
jgi:hypothetical protein